MELYKLYHRKSFFIWSVTAVLITVLYFLIQVEGEVCTIEGTNFRGLEAVRKNRQITEAYKGVLTDEKVRDIVGKYGLPKKVERDYPGFCDENYLNAFVTDYLSDGYLYDWDNYRIPTRIYPISETVIGELEEASGEQISLYYARGWKTFIEVLQYAMIMASVLILSGISVLFAEEGQTGMKQLIFTTKEGIQKDIAAKTAAAFTLTVCIYFGAVVLDLVMCAAVFGLDGLSCPLGITMNQQLSLDRNVPHPEACMQTGSFIGILLIVSLLAILVLCAVTLCVSAHFHSCFHAVMVSSACWGMPVMIRIFFGRFAYALMAGTPVFLIFYNNTLELLLFQILRVISLTFAITLLVVGIVCGYRGYKRNRFIF